VSSNRKPTSEQKWKKEGIFYKDRIERLRRRDKNSIISNGGKKHPFNPILTNYLPYWSKLKE
jgi:hypothetical protein